MSEIIVSICCQTYNHKEYVEQALNSFLMQKTNFLFEILLRDDASTDGTSEICKEFKSKYPVIINLLAYEENQWQKGVRPFLDNVKRAKGKYIALCEGDDYWTDPLKLQKQVDLLEGNDDFAICFHRVYELSEGKNLELSNLNTSIHQETYTIQDLAKGNFMYTPSVIFRNGLLKEFPLWMQDSPVGDYPLHMFNARHGKIKYFPDIMAVYRKHAGGAWSHHDIKINNVKMVRVIDYLLSEDFSDEVKVNLALQKRKCLNEYFHTLLQSDMELFIKELKAYSEQDHDLLSNWAFVEYPKLIGSTNENLANSQRLIYDIHETRAYKFAKKLARLKTKFLS